MNRGLLVTLARKLLFMQLVINQQDKPLVGWLVGWLVGFTILCLRELNDTENQNELTG